jgi:DNA invertase Pin-like site-specific DNA recombinase
MKVYSYCRTSALETMVADGETELALDAELLAIQTYCLQRDWYLFEKFQDRGVEWETKFKNRNNGARLLSLVSSGDIIICSHLERLVSSSVEARELVDFLRGRRVQLHIVELGGDIANKAFMLEFSIAAELFSKLDRRKSAERIKSVKYKQKSKGRYLGGSRPFGYMIHENGKLIENPIEQRLLKRILDLKRAGKSLRSISDEVSTPLAPVSFKTVQRLLQRHADRL